MKCRKLDINESRVTELRSIGLAQFTTGNILLELTPNAQWSLIKWLWCPLVVWANLLKLWASLNKSGNQNQPSNQQTNTYDCRKPGFLHSARLGHRGWFLNAHLTVTCFCCSFLKIVFPLFGREKAKHVTDHAFKNHPLLEGPGGASFVRWSLSLCLLSQFFFFPLTAVLLVNILLDAFCCSHFGSSRWLT